MHTVETMGFLVTFALCITLTTLMSRIGMMLVRRRGFTFGRLTAVHAISLTISWVLFVIWCSTQDKIYWFAGHVAFPPQTLWFIYDVLYADSGVTDEVGEEQVDISGMD